jgi:hypothetical protein
LFAFFFSDRDFNRVSVLVAARGVDEPSGGQMRCGTMKKDEDQKFHHQVEAKSSMLCYNFRITAIGELLIKQAGQQYHRTMSILWMMG